MLETFEIEPITYYDYPNVKKFDDKIWFEQKDISKELEDLNEKIKRYEKLGKRILKINKNPDLAKDGEEDAKSHIMGDAGERKFVKNLDVAKQVYDYYSFENETVQDIMHVIKPGEPMKSAIKKLVRMTKTVASLNPKTFKTYPFFDEYTEEDILKQIKEFDGVVRLCGSIDTYVKFEDGKAVGVYF